MPTELTLEQQLDHLSLERGQWTTITACSSTQQHCNNARLIEMLQQQNADLQQQLSNLRILIALGAMPCPRAVAHAC
jgi:predicted DNA-binding ribbon-helix-helix protein